MIDSFGDHLLGCLRTNLRSKHHDALRDIISNALLIDDKGSSKEQRFSSCTCDRPVDIFHSRPAYCDIPVRNSFEPKFVSSVATVAVAAGLAVEIDKDPNMMT